MIFRRWLFLGLALAAAIPTVGSARTILAAVPIGRTDLPWWRERHEEKLRELAHAKPELIFLGDSITQDWERSGPPEWQDFAPVWQRFYGDRHAVNLGFKGDTTASLIWRIQHGEVSGISPKAAVVLIGANNMGRPHWSADDTIAGIDVIISDLRKRLPSTKILLLGVLPSERSAWISETTAQINRMLAKRYKDDPSVSYLDLTALFMRNGVLNRDLFLDPKLTPPDPPLHPTAQAQAMMAKAMEPVLANMLGDRPHS
ncbi:MAG TPA: GDSL-type esterase/lipase family protein [Rhodopila sp.]|jgi:lysophospholipase L1-like esterase|nr:GDSL-type esterase/lipase family protein [Rhodopila sp.]